MPASFRDAVERRSIVTLTYLNSLPRVVPCGVVGALLLVGLLTTGPPAFAALALVAGLLGWLLYLGWPQMMPIGRVVRLLATLVIAAAAVERLTAS